jgi:vitamin B12 transporter
VAVQPPVVVTGAREPLAPERVAGDVVVIDEETIRATLADSLGDLLRREAGVQLSRAGGPGQGTGVLLRGAGAGQTVVLVDGVRVGSATLGLAALEQLGLAQVERIEILRGPGSTLVGADAIGGVVQVFTRRGTAAPRLELQAVMTAERLRPRPAWRAAAGTWPLPSPRNAAQASRCCARAIASAATTPTGTAFGWSPRMRAWAGSPSRGSAWP